MAIMKKSLFRLTDVLELCIAYTFCFSLNLMFDYVKTFSVKERQGPFSQSLAFSMLLAIYAL